VEIVLAFNQLGAGGGDSYVVTVAEQLERLGHGVTIFAPEAGALDSNVAHKGIRVGRSAGDLPDPCDVVMAQDTGTAYELAGRYPTTPQVFCATSELVDFQMPPQLPGVSAAVVALSERLARRVRALATRPRIVRLRQPIDTERFAPLESIRDRPERALVIGNWLRGRRLELLERAWGGAGVELTRAGIDATWTDTPEGAIGDADIVVAKGRAAIEGMACGRAVYVYDFAGVDGWVTPERYPALEADNFAGRAGDDAVDPDRLGADLAAYSSAMGVANRDLAIAHHGARRHAEELTALFSGLGPADAPPPGAYDELARLSRMQWQLGSRVLGITREAQLQQERALELERELARLPELERELTRLSEVELELARLSEPRPAIRNAARAVRRGLRARASLRSRLERPPR
jgi:hypothetical protein